MLLYYCWRCWHTFEGGINVSMAVNLFYYPILVIGEKGRLDSLVSSLAVGSDLWVRISPLHKAGIKQLSIFSSPAPLPIEDSN